MKAILFSNGMFAVFDADGEQVPELQGPLTKAGPKIYERIDEITSFEMSVYHKSIMDAPVSNLKCLTEFTAKVAAEYEAQRAAVAAAIDVFNTLMVTDIPDGLDADGKSLGDIITEARNGLLRALDGKDG